MGKKIFYSPIDFFEYSFRVKTLGNLSENRKAYRLRHESFVTELGWVQRREDELEKDQYDDERMAPLGVFNSTNDLIAYLRITLPHYPFMMEYEKMASISEPLEKTSDTIEISRVCTDVNVRKIILDNNHGKFNISMLLYKGLYQWCLVNHIYNMYMVVENKLFRLLKMSGFPCRQMGEVTLMPDGAKTVTVKVNWKDFDSQNISLRSGLLKWFNTTETIENEVMSDYESNPLCKATATA